jgi:hypothetical protein
MEAVTGAVELRSKDAREIERFVRGHLESLEDHALAIRLGSDGQYIAEFYSTKEPTV